MRNRFAYLMEFILLLNVFLLATPLDAEQQDFSFKTLMMPGKVHNTHAKYEAKCDSCHVESQDVSQTQLCVNCHEEIGGDIDSHSGFHGRSSNVSGAQCKSCHSEHMGRDGDIVNFDSDHFDHDLTDFALQGAHLDVPCQSCHLPQEKFREAGSLCVDCHKQDDRHNGAFTQSCQDCHSSQSWNETDFDHSSTDFDLRGEHKNASCNACHPDERYQDTPDQCYDCHVLNDVHGGINGAQCQDCHQQTKWQTITFDHNIDTDFDLLGKHQQVQCDGCHKQALFEVKPGNQCIDCHRYDDVHQGLNGSKCASCHTELTWQDSSFEHDLDTQFPLVGAHQSLSCNQCHSLGVDKDITQSECVDCHIADDVHQRQLGQTCDSCHSETQWLSDISFNHELSEFPLLGMHAVVACDSCHESQQFHNVQNQCNDCHADKDVHNNSLGSQCQTCHNPNGWLVWQFDHNTQTDYPLDGAHQGLTCSACHTSPVKGDIELASDCISCHLQDDKHEGRFGPACETCHVTSSFEKRVLQ